MSEIIIYNTVDGKATVALYAREGDVWMNQGQMAALFDTSVPNISIHMSNILKEEELNQDSVVKNFFTPAAAGENREENRFIIFEINLTQDDNKDPDYQFS